MPQNATNQPATTTQENAPNHSATSDERPNAKEIKLDQVTADCPTHLRKTRLCNVHPLGYSGPCSFAHSQLELRTQFCVHTKGTCPVGAKCKFEHYPRH